MESRLKNTRETAQGFFGKSERWLWEHTEPRGPIPCIRLGRTVLYDFDALQALIEAQQAPGGEA